MYFVHSPAALVRVLVLLLAAVAFVGCLRTCPPGATSAATVWLNDAVTDEPITQATVIAIAEADRREFPFAEGADGIYSTGPAHGLPTPRAGTYTIRVTRDGYLPTETRADVPPGGGTCNPGVLVPLTLQREPR